MALGRRRIPYALGGDMLPRPNQNSLQRNLTEEEASKLSGDMRELYDRLLPTPESEDRRTRFVTKLDEILNKAWPGNYIKVHVFGSSGNLLCTSDSDGLSSRNTNMV
jgi:DNA polymerase sigma